MPSPASPAPRPSLRSLVVFWSVIVFIVLAIIAGSLTLRQSLRRSVPDPPPPDLGALSLDLEAVERTGVPVKASSLSGKVRIYAHLYTVCPHGCAAVVAEMTKLLALYRGRPDFHMVSVAVIPERDTPEFFKLYAEGLGVKPEDPWWFLTGKRDAIETFMVDGLKLEKPRPIPPEERLNPLDFYEHDLRLVLVDRKGHIRGYYSVFDPSEELAALMRDKLQKDVRRLLDNPRE